MGAQSWAPWEQELRRRVERGQTVVASVTADRRKQRYLHLLEWAQRRGRYVYVGRPVRWAGENPYVHGPYDWSNPYKLGDGAQRLAVIARYENEHLPRRPYLLERLPELRGKVLGCWCAPEPCHADVLARLAQAS